MQAQERIPYITFEGTINKRRKIDLDRFTADLAKALGCAVIHGERHQIAIGTDVLHLNTPWQETKVSVSISAPDVKYEDRNTYDESHKTAVASVNPDGRSIQAIAADIKRRVVDASQRALQMQRLYAAQIVANRNETAERAAALKAAAPYLDIRVNEKDRCAAIYSGGGKHYLSARLSSDGTISIDRIGSLTIDQFYRVLSVLDCDPDYARYTTEGGDRDERLRTTD